MGKPQPPDQTRIELVINGEDPESHRSAQEAARILSAPQIARTVQKQIEECRQQISNVVWALHICNMVVQNNSVSCYGSQHINLLAMSPEIQIACLSVLSKVKDSYLSIAECSRANAICLPSVIGYEQIAKVLTESLPRLQEELKKHESQLDALLAVVIGK